MVKEIGSQQELERQDRIRLNLNILKEGQPYIVRQLDDLEARRGSLEPAQYLRERFLLSGQLWELGGHRSAWMGVWHDFERDGAALPPADRLQLGTQLARMMAEDGSPKHGAQVLHKLKDLASQENLSRELRFSFWELNAQCLVGIGEMQLGSTAVKNAQALAPTPLAKAKLDALLAEFYFMQGEIDKALEAATIL